MLKEIRYIYLRFISLVQDPGGCNFFNVAQNSPPWTSTFSTCCLSPKRVWFGVKAAMTLASLPEGELIKSRSYTIKIYFGTIIRHLDIYIDINVIHNIGMFSFHDFICLVMAMCKVHNNQTGRIGDSLWLAPESEVFPSHRGRCSCSVKMAETYTLSRKRFSSVSALSHPAWQTWQAV